MSPQRINLIFWLRAASITALALALTVVATTVIVSWSLSGALEWALFAASLGGAVGSLQYRAALAVPTLSRHCGFVWLLSVGWATLFLLVALKAGEPYPADQATFLARLGAMLGLAAAMSLMCLFPLKWLQGVGSPRHAP